MENLSLFELYSIKHRIIKEGLSDDILLDEVNETIKFKEEQLLKETSATGGAVSGGSGAVVSAQPSGLAGQTIGPNWASHGGTVGSGDISTPYNPSSTNRMSQTFKSPMGKNHGARTGKKSRVKKLDIKALKAMMAKSKEFDSGDDNGGGEKKDGKKKVLNFNDFLKNDFTTIKK